jgi:hypothetical protein
MTRIPASSTIRFMPRVCAVLVLAAVIPSCDDTVGPRPSPIPAPTPAPELATEVTISGTVYEHTASGPRPLARLPFTVRLTETGWGYGGGDTQVTSDPSGRYSASWSDEEMMVTIVLPAGAGYHAPCPSGFDVLAANATMDVHVVADATLSTTGVPSSLPVSGPSVSGDVFERVQGGLRPVSGATIDLYTDPSAKIASVTLTDARGAFLLCANPPGTGAGQLMWVTARKEGYREAIQQVLLSGDEDHVNFEIVRQ